MRALSRRIQKKAEWVFWAVISRADWNGQEVITVIVRVSVCMYVFLSTPVGWAQFNQAHLPQEVVFSRCWHESVQSGGQSHAGLQNARQMIAACSSRLVC